MPDRRHFAEDAPAAASEAPTRHMRYPCAAHQCPMPGTIFPGGGRDGACAWHAMESPRHWPRITQAIVDWQCVQQAISRMQRVAIDPEICADVKAQEDAMAAEWLALFAAVQGAGWEPRLRPLKGETPSCWAYRLRLFLVARVKEYIAAKSPGSIDEAAPTPFVVQARQSRDERVLRRARVQELVREAA